MEDPLAFRRECGTCLHYREGMWWPMYNRTVGHCHLNAPVDPPVDSSNRQVKGVWPIVMPESHCHQWDANLSLLEDRARQAVKDEAAHWKFAVRRERDESQEYRIPDTALEVE